MNSKKILFTYKADQYILFRGKNAMLFRVMADGLQLVDVYAVVEQQEIDRISKVLWKWYTFTHLKPCT